MIYVFENPDNNASIIYVDTTLTEEEKRQGIAIDKLPAKDNLEGKQAMLKCKKSTNEVWYEYVDVVEIPKKEDVLEQLKLENAELMMKSATTDMEIETVKNENAELLFRVANLEMGGSTNV